MSEAPDPALELLPNPREGDDDDVAWALQTAHVQWKRGSREDALTWLERAVEAAKSIDDAWRAAELSAAALRLRKALEVFEDETQVTAPLSNAPEIDDAELIAESIVPPAPSVAPEVDASELLSVAPAAASRPPLDSVAPISVEPESLASVAGDDGGERESLEPESLPPSLGATSLERPPQVSAPPPRTTAGAAKPAPAVPPPRPTASISPPRPGASVAPPRPGTSVAPLRPGASVAPPRPRVPPATKPEGQRSLAAKPPPPRAVEARPAPPPLPEDRVSEVPISVEPLSDPLPESREPAASDPAPAPMETAIFERELPPLDSSPVSALPPSVDDFAAEVPPSERESPFDSDPGDALPAALRGGPLAEAEREERVVSALETPIPGRVRELLPFELDDAAEAERVLSARSSSPNLVPEAPTPRAPKTSSANLSALRPPTPPVSRPSIKSLPAVAPPPPSAAKAAASPGEGAVPAKASPDGSVAIAKAPPAPRPSAKSPTPPAPSVRPSAAPEAAPFASLERPASIPPPAAPAARALDSAFLASVRGLEDLPEEAHAELVARAARRRLELDEEVGAFAVAVVLSGSVSVLPAVSDLACARVGSGEVVFTQGTLEAAVALRIVATAPGTEVAVWEQAALDAAVADCPWVADDLATIADRFQALAGATMGVFGERLDDVMFGEISARCALRALSEGELLFEQGKEVGGLAIVGVGRLSLLDGEAETAELGPGDLVFPAELMGHQPAPWSARAGAGGALLLFAERRVAHELMVSVPPLLEVLAS